MNTTKTEAKAGRHSWRFLKVKADKQFPELAWRVFECECCGLLKRDDRGEAAAQSGGARWGQYQHTQYHRRGQYFQDGTPKWMPLLKDLGEAGKCGGAQ